MVQQRNIATCIILTIVTCGIYGIYWLVCLNDDTNKLSQEPNPTSGGMVILLTIVTCGIYGFYWAYKQGEKLDRASQMRGMTSDNKGVIYLILTFVGLGIVAYALMQDSINKLSVIAPGYGQPYGQQPYGQPYGYSQPQQPYGQPQQPNDHNPYN